MQATENKPRILIVDDNPNIHRDFELVFDADFNSQSLDAEEKALFGEANTGTLHQGVYQIDHAFSGAEGVEKVSQALVEERHYQMAFVDIRMPGIDGVETVARIWKLDPAIQIVICTAFADYSQEDLTHRLGQTDKLLVLKKPFDTIEVTQLASTLTAKWHLARQAALKMEQMELLVARRTEKVLDLQRREAQRIHELDQMKLQFLNNFVNEFRTPLTLLATGVEQMLAAGTLKLSERDLLHNNATRLLHLVNHLTDLHTLETGELKPEIARADVMVLLRGVIRIFQSIALQQKVDLQFEAADDAITFGFDANKLEKVIFLILSNTLQTTPPGGRVRVKVGLGRTALQIVIENEGGAIPHSSEQHPLLWLELARRLAESQQATLTLSGSVSTTGSTSATSTGFHFTISLPWDEKISNSGQAATAAPAAELATASVGVSADTAEASTGREEWPTVLIIEADEELRRHIRQHFETEYRIVEAAGSGSIFETAKEAMPDLIIADLGLTQDRGLEFCTQLKSDDLTSHIPVILLAAQGDEQLQMRALQAGADEFMVKPFRLMLLKARASNLLETRRRLRERPEQSTSLQPWETATNQMDLQFMKRITGIVEKNLSDFEFNVDTLARELSISRRQLFRKIKAVTNATPNMLIRSLRLNRAAQLLKESRLTVSEITYAVGFSDLKHFREVFQEQFGVLPGDYAERR